MKLPTLPIAVDDSSYQKIYSAHVKMIVETVRDTAETSVLNVRVGFDPDLFSEDWVTRAENKPVKLNERGFRALALAYVHGLNTTVRMASTLGLNEADFLRDCISELERLFAEAQVKYSYQNQTPPHGTAQ